ncbi:MAG: hypothetical protein HC862_13930 [Scytonema sp. RU_4_4]|nr:hypothetical protein [Scytonema sp. RU_4_4]NJR73946.1 hypothetical protein [Scytonema sp. CRU_2_7]
MLNIGDYAQHQITGQIGQVIGYGHQILHGVYLTTLKVRATNTQEMNHQSRFIEDVYSAWVLAESTESGVVLQA